MTPRNKHGWLRLLAFFIIPVIAVALANSYLMQTDAVGYYTLYEMTHTDDIDLALVGSSVVRNNFDPFVISEKTGLKAYDVTLGYMSMQSAIATTKLMFETHSPKYVALVMEPYNMTETAEDPQSQQRLWHFLKNPIDKLTYYLDLCSQDNKYIERALIFRTLCVESPADIKKTIDIRRDPAEYYTRSGLTEGPVIYKGRGFTYVTLQPEWGAMLNETSLQPHMVSEYIGMPDYTARKIREYRKLCEENGAELIVVIAPDLVAHRLALYGYIDKAAMLMDFCKAEGIPCYDFSIPRPEFIPRLDDYFYDWYHLNGVGAGIFSEKFAEFFNLYTAGEPVDHLFYSSQQDFLQDIDYITNAWIIPTSDGVNDIYTANCNRGPNVTPEYQFVVRHADETETVLRDYSTDNVFTTPAGQISGETLVVYVRPQQSPEQRPVYYTLDR